MITYEITSRVDAELTDRYELYMRERHIPDLLATGCFTGASFSRGEDGTYRIRYEAPDRPSLDRYLAEHAPRLRAHALEAFPAGMSLERHIWEVLQSWPS